MTNALSPELTSAYISAGVAALAIIASVLTTWLTLRHQRALAQEDRLSGRRAAAYESLLRYQHENPAFSGLLPADVASGINAYGSAELHNMLDRVRRAGNDPDRFDEAIDSLLAQIRLELQNTRDRRPLRATTRWRGESRSTAD